MTKAIALLLKHWEVFSVDGSFGKTDLIQHEIVTIPKPPIKERFRPINPILEEDLKRQLKEWLAHDVIEPSKSPWNFALVAASKKNSTKKRWCVDYRPLNAITVKDSFPLPQIEDNLVRLGRSRIFSGIDGCGAYHVVEVAPKDRPKTAFSTPLGSFQFKRMPFGLTNAPATYCRLVQMVLEGIPYDMAIPYLDDTCVHSPDLPGHFRALDRVLGAHAKAGLKLQPSKCSLFQNQIEYLGHVVSAGGVSPPAQYVRVIQDWPLPKTKTQARAFLGKVGYYRRFIKGYGSLARPWTDVTGKGSTPEEEKAPLAVTQEMKDSFHQLKKCLLTAPILAYARFDLDTPFILDTDWSAIHGTLGAVLSQVQDGKERVICYGAKRMQASEKNYPPCKAELLAFIHFVKSWKYYLLHRRFIWRTDHAGLQYLRTMDPPEGMVGRWLQVLAHYDFDIQYRPGPKHGNADALSRIEHAPEVAETFDEGGLCAISPTWAVPPKEMLHHQEADPDLRVVRQWLSDGAVSKAEMTAGSTALKTYGQVFDQLHLDHDRLICRTKDDTPLVCVPLALIPRVIRHAHMVGGHQASEATAQRLRQRCYFPSFVRLVREWVSTCGACAARGPAPKPQRGQLVSYQDGYPFQRLSLDFVGPLARSREGHSYLFTIKDTFSRWFEAFPVRRTSARAAVRSLEFHIFPRFGLPEVIHADRGSAFTGREFQTMCRELQIRLTHTPAYHPQSNPVERSHRDLKAILTALLDGRDPSTWEDYLPQALFAMRTAVSSATGASPFQLLFGHDPSMPLSILFRAPESAETMEANESSYAAQLRCRMEAAHAYARQHMAAEVRRRRRQYGQALKHFDPGALVWLFTSRTRDGGSRKLTRYWSGPWTVHTKINPLLVEIAPDGRWPWPKQNQTVATDRLKPFLAAPDESYPPDYGADFTEGGDETALAVPIRIPDRRLTASRESSDDDSDADDVGGGGGGPDGPGPPRGRPFPPGPGPPDDDDSDGDDGPGPDLPAGWAPMDLDPPAGEPPGPAPADPGPPAPAGPVPDDLAPDDPGPPAPQEPPAPQDFVMDSDSDTDSHHHSDVDDDLDPPGPAEEAAPVGLPDPDTPGQGAPHPDALLPMQEEDYWDVSGNAPVAPPSSSSASASDDEEADPSYLPGHDTPPDREEFVEPRPRRGRAALEVPPSTSPFAPRVLRGGRVLHDIPEDAGLPVAGATGPRQGGNVLFPEDEEDEGAVFGRRGLARTPPGREQPPPLPERGVHRTPPPIPPPVLPAKQKRTTATPDEMEVAFTRNPFEKRGIARTPPGQPSPSRGVTTTPEEPRPGTSKEGEEDRPLPRRRSKSKIRQQEERTPERFKPAPPLPEKKRQTGLEGVKKRTSEEKGAVRRRTLEYAAQLKMKKNTQKPPEKGSGRVTQREVTEPGQSQQTPDPRTPTEGSQARRDDMTTWSTEQLGAELQRRTEEEGAEGKSPSPERKVVDKGKGPGKGKKSLGKK